MVRCQGVGAYNLWKQIGFKRSESKLMEIMTVPFHQPLTLEIHGDKVEINCFETVEHGNIKFGINAPRSMNIDREEVYFLKKLKDSPSSSD